MVNRSMNQDTGTPPMLTNGYQKWPFLCTNLFYTEEEDRASQNTDVPVKGIFSYKHACGFVYHFADEAIQETGRCVSAVIIQAGERKDEEPANGNRIDIDQLKHVAGAGCPYRLCLNRHEQCSPLEDRVAKTVIGAEAAKLDPKEMTAGIQAVLSNLHSQQPCVVRDETMEQKEAPPECAFDYAEACRLGDRLYFKYNCPWSLVGGVLMPIFANGAVVAAAIVGQFAWSDVHKDLIQRRSAKQPQAGTETPGLDVCYDLERNEKIIQLLAQEIEQLEGALTQRIRRNAAGLFFRVSNEVHSGLAKSPLNLGADLRAAFREVFSKLLERLSFSELRFYPYKSLSSAGSASRPETEAFPGSEGVVRPGAVRRLPTQSPALRREQLNPRLILVSSEDRKVCLTIDATAQYSLRLYDEEGAELCQLSFVLPKPEGRGPVRQEELETLCYHMETVLRELYFQWALMKREEEHAQYHITMRQFTHELGQKSHSGLAATEMIQRQLADLISLVASSYPTDASAYGEVMKGFDRLTRSSRDLDTIFVGIEYLSQLARAKTKGLQFNPVLYNVRLSTLNSLAAQYRIEIRGRGMKIQQETATANTLYGDPSLVHIAIHNLVSNAVKYGYPGTNIYYSCYNGRGRDGRRGTLIDVTDYGMYIPKEERERIFLDGQRLGEERGDSMGFGLFLTREIMTLHGGYCEVAESEIISPVALPNLKEMARLAETSVYLSQEWKDELKDEWTAVQGTALYKRVVHREIRVSKDVEPVITPRNLYREGLRPMAKTTMRLFFPERSER